MGHLKLDIVDDLMTFRDSASGENTDVPENLLSQIPMLCRRPSADIGYDGGRLVRLVKASEMRHATTGRNAHRTIGKLFSVVGGQPQRIDEHRSKDSSRRYWTRQETRELLATA